MKAKLKKYGIILKYIERGSVVLFFICLGLHIFDRNIIIEKSMLAVLCAFNLLLKIACMNLRHHLNILSCAYNELHEERVKLQREVELLQYIIGEYEDRSRADRDPNEIKKITFKERLDEKLKERE